MAHATGPVALTGGTGFIGAEILRQTVERGIPIRALARRPDTLPSHVEAVRGDLQDNMGLASLCAGAATLVHCAGAVRARNAAEFHAVNAVAAGRLARIAAQSGVSRFVLVSSLAARQPELSPYAASKREGERQVESRAAGMTVVTVRPPAVYGPGDQATLPIFRQAARGWFVMPGRPGLRLALLHVADLARLILDIALGDAANAGQVIEPGAPNGIYAWPEIAEAAAEAANRARLRTVAIPQPVAWAAGAAGSAAALALGRAPLFSVGKVREAFHPDWSPRAGVEQSFWSPQIALREGFRATFDWYKERKWL